MKDAEPSTIIFLLQKEVECLRSVLSEFEGDKSEYTQMIRANILTYPPLEFSSKDNCDKAGFKITQELTTTSYSNDPNNYPWLCVEK